MGKVSSWVKTKTVTLTGIASFVAGMGNKYGWWSIDPNDVVMGVGLLLTLVVSGTVTSNTRLGDGKMWKGYDGHSE